MLITRSQLKAIKKDITEQLKSGITVNDLYINNWITYGDNIFEGNSDKYIFDGKLTSKELKAHTKEDNYKACKINDIIIVINEDNSIDIEVRAILIDEYDNMTDWEFIKLNI